MNVNKPHKHCNAKSYFIHYVTAYFLILPTHCWYKSLVYIEANETIKTNLFNHNHWHMSAVKRDCRTQRNDLQRHSV